MRSIRAPAISILALVAAGPLRAQQQGPPGTLEGTVHEKIESRSVRAASVSLLRIEPGSPATVQTRPDERGRYRLDSLPAGRYRVRVDSPALDSLEVTPPAAEVRIAPGKVARADFTLPYGASLRDAVCHDSPSAPARVAVAGRAIDADADDRPLAGAELVARWMEFPLDRSTHRSVPTKRVTVVTTGPKGEYRVCGAPSETLFSLQLRHEGRAGAVIRLIVSEEEGAVVRDLSLSTRTAPTIAALDSLDRAAAAAGPDAPRGELHTTGDAVLTGTVRGLSGQPFRNARVHVRNARASGVTDSLGHFVLAGLPAGTQILEVRHLDYSPVDIAVELRAGKAAEQLVLLVRPPSLDAAATEPTEYEAFDSNRRTNRFGQFLTQEQIDQKKYAAETVDLFDDLLGFTALGHGDSARVISNSALANHPECTNARVVIEGGSGRRVNDVTPGQIAGIEAYSDAAFVPARFAGKADCGVIVIWLRKAPRAPSHPPAGLRSNGYP